MVDSSTSSAVDTSITQVKSSYDDVNTALEKLLSSVAASSSSVSETDLNNAITALQNKISTEYMPASGGQITGTITGSAGGTIPQVIGLSGKVVEQDFIVYVDCSNGNNPHRITFPTPFAAGTVPVVMMCPTRGLYSNDSALCIHCIDTDGNGNAKVDNTGVTVQTQTVSNWSSGAKHSIHVRVTGVM